MNVCDGMFISLLKSRDLRHVVAIGKEITRGDLQQRFTSAFYIKLPSTVSHSFTCQAILIAIRSLNGRKVNTWDSLQTTNHKYNNILYKCDKPLLQRKYIFTSRFLDADKAIYQDFNRIQAFWWVDHPGIARTCTNANSKPFCPPLHSHDAIASELYVWRSPTLFSHMYIISVFVVWHFKRNMLSL